MSASDGVYETVQGTVCNATQYRLSKIADANITCLTHGQSIGLALTAEASFISCVAVIIILVLIGRNVRWYRKKFPGGNWKLFQRPTDVYMFFLFVFDFLQAMAGIFDVRWAHNGIVETGHYCTAQGIVQQIGGLGVAQITLLLAVHNFVAALWEVGLEARSVAFGLVFVACAYIALWVGIGAGHLKNYEAPVPYWCWISAHYSGERLGGEYIWLWLALFASVILYVPLHFWTEGRLSISEERWWWPKFHESKFDQRLDQRVDYRQRRAALSMIVYPLAYSISVLPLSVSRWLNFGGHNVPSAATFFGVIMLNLSGATNVFLFLIFKPRLLLFSSPDRLGDPEIELLPQGNSSAISTGTAKSQHTPEPTRAALAGEGADSSSGRILDDDI